MGVVVEGGTELTLKVGGSFVKLSPAGVDIKGPLVNINSGGSAGSGTAAVRTHRQRPRPRTRPRKRSSPKKAKRVRSTKPTPELQRNTKRSNSRARR